jgi:hypothetical protein
MQLCNYPGPAERHSFTARLIKIAGQTKAEIEAQLNYCIKQRYVQILPGTASAIWVTTRFELEKPFIWAIAMEVEMKRVPPNTPDQGW